MKKYEKAVLRFAKHPDVAFTNNRAERDLRMSEGQAESLPGASAPESTPKPIAESPRYLQSMANQGYNRASGHSNRSRRTRRHNLPE